MRFAIYGAGGFGREVAPVAEAMALTQSPATEVVFVSDFDESLTNGRELVRLEQLTGDDEIVIAVADVAARRALVGRCEALGLRFGSIVASSHIRYDAVDVGEGSIFCDRSILTSNIRIGRHFHCNLNAYVAHDCSIGDFVTFAPNVCCNGNVTIGDDVYVGTGALIKPGVTSGRGAVIGMGAVVVRDVREGATVVGNPGRIRDV
jgi:sugar O-acyltransferase (sialic acid O-acetyltransferase NeuD family)